MSEVSQIRVKGTLYDIKDAVARLATGAPAVASTAAGMTDTSKIYVYTGTESGYTKGHWYYHDGTSWVSGGVYQSSGIETDSSLSVSGAAADAKVTGDAINNVVYVGTEATDSHTQVLVSPTSTELDIVTQADFDAEISDLKSQINRGSGLTEGVKQALLAIANHIGAWTDGNSQSYISALQSALYPPANLVSISAVYTQSGTVYTSDSLDDLKADLVVTGLYDDSSSREITSGYTLSGELETGVSTITVAYGGKTTTFTVNVTYNDTTVVYRLPSPTVFDGSTTYVNTGVSPFRSDHDFTFVATFKAPTTQNSYCGVWASGDGNTLYALRPTGPESGIWSTYGGGKTAAFVGANITVTSENDVVRYVFRHKTGQKHEVFGSVNGTTVVNGTQIGTTAMQISGVELRLGRSYSNNTYFTGTIDEFVVYERALTDDEITAYLAE